MEEKKSLWQLFKSTLYLSAFTFGGGYVIISLMKDTFVDKLGWLEKGDMLDMTAIAQSAPGAVAILATIIPPLVIISTISVFYKAFIANKFIATFLKGMQAGVAALIFKVVIDMTKDLLKLKSKTLILVMILSFLAGFVFKINIVYIILTLILVGLIYSWKKKGESRAS